MGCFSSIPLIASSTALKPALMGELLLGELVIGSPQWVFPAIAIGTLLTFLVIWNYARSGGRTIPTGWLGVLLKLAAIALLCVCLVQPMRRAERPRPRANLLPIVVDTSGSMDLTIGRDQESWRDRIEQNFQADSPIMASLSQTFETRVYGFDKRLASANAVSELSRSGTSSRLVSNLDELVQRLRDRPVAGVLLMTDGNDAGGADVLEQLETMESFPFPIFPVVPAQVSGMNDLRITNTSVAQTNFEISPVTLSAQIQKTGNLSGKAIVRLTDVTDETIVKEQSISLDQIDGSTTVSFQFRPRDVGLRFYRVDVFRESDRQAFGQIDGLAKLSSSETTLINNTRLVAVDRRTGPYRVLYVAGRPNWEFKFLRRAVSEDAEVELTGLIRMANKEPKFSFRDKGVSNTNPLFQGLGDDAEETAEQYDEPVMIRVGVKESSELASGFPKTEDELFGFDALVIDDIEPDFFTQDQLDMIRRFVSVRGAGMMMLGGQEMFRGRKFEDSLLGDLSPVYAKPGGEREPSPHTLGLTREGMLQPFLRLRSTSAEETKRLRKMPRFDSINSLGSLKPGAFQLATLTNFRGDLFPAIAVHRFGKGKVGAVAVADLWRWAMKPDPEHPDDSAQAWRQLTRWLVSDVPRRAEASLKTSPNDPDQIVVRATALDENYDPLDDAEVSVTIRKPNRDQLKLNARPIAESPGVYTVSYIGNQPGPYVATSEIRSADGELLGTPEIGWARQIAGSEFDRLGVNRELLESIATKSGGAVVSEKSLDGFSRRLNSQKVPVMETWVFPLWHRGWVIGLALALLCGEWGLRRLRGLA